MTSKVALSGRVYLLQTFVVGERWDYLEEVVSLGKSDFKFNLGKIKYWTSASEKESSESNKVIQIIKLTKSIEIIQHNLLEKDD